MTHRSVPRSIADLSGGLILATVDIGAAPERVFKALSSDEIVQWWGDSSMYHTTAWSADVRVGGSWRADGKAAGGSAYSVGGESTATVASTAALASMSAPIWSSPRCSPGGSRVSWRRARGLSVR